MVKTLGLRQPHAMPRLCRAERTTRNTREDIPVGGVCECVYVGVWVCVGEWVMAATVVAT